MLRKGPKMNLSKYRLRATDSRAAATTAAGVLALATLVTLLMLSFADSARSAQATVPLGDAESFGALSFTAMTNAGANTVVNGNIGSSTSIDAEIGRAHV